MTEQGYTVREIFSYYGRTMYLAQAIEKGIMNLIVVNQHKHGITKTRYDEIPPDDLITAENELVALSDLFQKVTEEKEQLGVDINPFTHYGTIFFPEI